MMEPIKVNGIRSSDRILQLSQRFDRESDCLRLYQLLAADRINISFLYLDYSSPERLIVCCIPSEKLHHARAYPAKNPGESSRFSCLPDTGLVSVYPHRFSLDVIGFFIQLHEHRPIPFRCMASSNSMLSFVLGYNDRDRTAEMLTYHLDLPPFRTPDCLPRDYDHIAAALRKDPETVATYVESRIKVYGIQTRVGLVICRLTIAPDDMAGWGNDIRKFSELGLQFLYTQAVRDPDGLIRLDLVLDADRVNETVKNLETAVSRERTDCMQLRSGVEMIHLQGPHFGDRYGIADAALSILHRNGIPVLAAGCVGASVTVILPAGAMGLAESVLREVFQVP